MILTSTVFDGSTRVTDGGTDRHDRQADGRNCDRIYALYSTKMLSRVKICTFFTSHGVVAY